MDQKRIDNLYYIKPLITEYVTSIERNLSNIVDGLIEKGLCMLILKDYEDIQDMVKDSCPIDIKFIINNTNDTLLMQQDK